MGWNEIHKLIFAKKSLKGLAKLFVQGEKNMTTLKKLKGALAEEFSTKMSAAQLHRTLDAKKMKKQESVSEYFLKIKELASRGDVDEGSLIQYVIDYERIRHDDVKKIVLYGARNLHDFKMKIKDYEKMTKAAMRNTNEEVQRHDKDGTTTRVNNDVQKQNVSPIRCFNCGGMGHRSAICFHKSRGPRCFKCGAFGHKETEYEDSDAAKKKDESQQAQIRLLTQTDEAPLRPFHQRVTIHGQTFEALIDTGSAVNVIRRDIHEKLATPDLEKNDIQLTGFGGSEMKPLGYYKDKIIVDDEEFLTQMFVVPTNAMREEILIGQHLLCHAELKSNGIQTTLRKTRLEPFLIDVESSENIEIGRTVPILLEKKSDVVEPGESVYVSQVVVERKRGKQVGFLHPLPKEGAPLHTSHEDHLEPL